MQFIHADASRGSMALAKTLIDSLNTGARVLWLVSGGSNIPLTIQALEALPDKLTAGLTIMPVDERYGPLEHATSNVRQLYAAGFVPKYARFVPVLSGKSFHATVRHFAGVAHAELEMHRVIVAQLGMGADGHIAGILPHSPASSEGGQLVQGYEGPDYQRITLTFTALRRASVAYLFAYGENKRPALERLRANNLSLAEQPAQIIKTIPSAYVYNDQLEGE